MLTETMKEREGKLVNVQVTVLDPRLVDEYLAAVGEDDPLWRDAAAALAAGHPRVPVHPGLLTTMQMEGGSPSGHMPEQAHLGGAVDGGGEWEFLLPVYVGDVLVATRELVAVKERRGKLGQMLVNAFQVTYRNQRSEVVASGRWSTIRYATNQ